MQFQRRVKSSPTSRPKRLANSKGTRAGAGVSLSSERGISKYGCRYVETEGVASEWFRRTRCDDVGRGFQFGDRRTLRCAINICISLYDEIRSAPAANLFGWRKSIDKLLFAWPPKRMTLAK